MSLRSHFGTEKIVKELVGQQQFQRKRAWLKWIVRTKMKRRIVFLTSDPMSILAFMLPHIRELNDFFDIRVMANASDSSLLKKRGLDVVIEIVPVVRPISLISDIRALWILYWRFRHHGPSAVHTITPKAGLLGMGAAFLARVPMRVHSFTGQVWVTRRGSMRWLLKVADKCTAFLATDILVDSPSQQAFLIKQGVLSPERSKVLGSGSICGVNTKRFCPNSDVRESVRIELATDSQALVCLYLGRLNPDKGILDLASAFAAVAEAHPQAELWVVGPDEANWFEQMQVRLKSVIHQVKRVGYTTNPERFMQAADLFCMPSHREGFGSSVIEAAACKVPALTSHIYGLTDAVVDGKTGWMHEAGSVSDIRQKLNELLSDPASLSVRGENAYRYAREFFSEEIVVGAMVDLYKKRFIVSDEHN